MFKPEKLSEIEKARSGWEEGPLNKSLERFGIKESLNKFYTPLDIKNHDFLDKVGFPGEYPFTAGEYPTYVPGSGPVSSGIAPESGGGLIRAGGYSGYGAPEDTRDYYKYMASLGQRGGPNLAFDLPTQCGYDSDDSMARGEVGRTGVAVDTLRDWEVIYEAFTDDSDLDKIASNWTINAPCNIILAMHIALAEKRGIPQSKLRGTPQNNILKEFVARGTYIFPPKPSMRMIRDTILYCSQNIPLMNTISIYAYHMREAGATAVQGLAFTLSHAIAYTQLGIEAGLDVDDFLPRFSFLSNSGSMDFFGEIALARAGRRMWAKIARGRLGAKKPRSWLMRGAGGAHQGYYSATAQRPLNNLTRSVIGGIASALSGGAGQCDPPFDEALGLGWSLEARQLALDAARIINCEARLRDVIDPLAGSYYVEALTEQIEAEAWALIDKIDAMGGAVAAVENGFMDHEIARSAYEFQRQVEAGERCIVGVNRFIGEHEFDVTVNTTVSHPYDPSKRVDAEQRQLANLAKVKRERDNHEVKLTLKRLEEAAQDESVNLIPLLVNAVKAYATIGEICGTLRKVFGEYRLYVSI